MPLYGAYDSDLFNCPGEIATDQHKHCHCIQMVGREEDHWLEIIAEHKIAFEQQVSSNLSVALTAVGVILTAYIEVPLAGE